MLLKVSLAAKWFVIAFCTLSILLSCYELPRSVYFVKYVFLVVNILVQMIGIKGVYYENILELYVFAVMLFNSLIVGFNLPYNVQFHQMPLVTFVIIQSTLGYTMLLRSKQSLT